MIFQETKLKLNMRKNKMTQPKTQKLKRVTKNKKAQGVGFSWQVIIVIILLVILMIWTISYMAGLKDKSMNIGEMIISIFKNQ